MQKIYYRLPLFWSLIVFVIMTLVFTYLSYSFVHQVSAVNLTVFMNFAAHYWYIFTLAAITILAIYMVSSLSRVFFLAFHGVILVNCMSWLNKDWNHLIFIATSIYFLFTFICWSQLHWALKLPLYRGTLHPYVLVRKDQGPISIRIKDKKNHWHHGLITDWSDESIHVKMIHDVLPDNLIPPSRVVETEITVGRLNFNCDMIVASSYKKQKLVGLLPDESSRESLPSGQQLPWKKFLQLVESLGFSNKVLR